MLYRNYLPMCHTNDTYILLKINVLFSANITKRFI